MQWQIAMRNTSGAAEKGQKAINAQVVIIEYEHVLDEETASLARPSLASRRHAQVQAVLLMLNSGMVWATL